MNRISLYEALRRKKDAEGLNTVPQVRPVPEQTSRAEPRIQLKQPPSREILEKKPVKHPINTSLMAKNALFHREKVYSGRILDSLKEFIKNNPTTVWTGIAVVVVALVLFIFLPGKKSGGQGGAEPERRSAATNSGETRNTENTVVVRQPQVVPPVVPQQKEKPVVQRPPQKVQPEVSVKSQLPPAIQSRLEQKPPAETKPQEPAKPAGAGDHVIVIVAYTKQEDLAPVAAYFKQNGIETEILRQGSYYLLTTKERFENPEKAGTDGYRMKQTIKRVGANYKAPGGYEKFSSTPFQDVYGKKVK
jgi:hypothetical protein